MSNIFQRKYICLGIRIYQYINIIRNNYIYTFNNKRPMQKYLAQTPHRIHYKFHHRIHHKLNHRLQTNFTLGSKLGFTTISKDFKTRARALILILGTNYLKTIKLYFYFQFFSPHQKLHWHLVTVYDQIEHEPLFYHLNKNEAISHTPHQQ